MSIWITNAYDSSNIGDGFLLESVLRRSRIPAELADDVVVVSNTPSSVGDAGERVTLGGVTFRTIQAPNASTRRDLRGLAPQALKNVLGFGALPVSERPAAIVAMAGGYTSFTGTGSSLTYLNDHYAMIDLPRRYAIPALMFPVSIGPLKTLARRRILRAYRGFNTIMVRDDESAAELDGLANVLRVPDLAVQAIAADLSEVVVDPSLAARVVDEPIMLIGRDLGAEFPAYPAKARELNERTRGLWRLQVPKDEAFYKANGLRYEAGAIDHSATSSRHPVVVSVRLHGALLSILNQVPAIHLSYDRKGAGAYNDLGIAEWLHDANTFDPELVARQAVELSRDPSRFWQALGSRLPAVLDSVRRQDGLTDEFWATLSPTAARRV